MRVGFAVQQFGRALADAFGPVASKVSTVIEEESQQVEVLGAGQGFEVSTEGELEKALNAALENAEQFNLLNVHLGLDDHSQALNRLSKRLASQVRPRTNGKK